MDRSFRVARTFVRDWESHASDVARIWIGDAICPAHRIERLRTGAVIGHAGADARVQARRIVGPTVVAAGLETAERGFRAILIRLTHVGVAIAYRTVLLVDSQH